MPKFIRRSRHDQMSRLCLDQGCEHRTNSTEVNVRYRDSDINSGEQQQNVLDHADPRHPPHAAYEDECGNQRASNNHGGRMMNASETRNFDNQSEPDDLYLYIGDQAQNANEGNERTQICAAVSHLEEIGLRLKAVLLPNFPNEWKGVEGNHIN